MHRPIRRALASLSVLLALSTSAWARVDIVVDLDSQRLTATRGDGETATWPVSTGRFGLETPRGDAMKIFRTDIDHHSEEYDQAPMPYAMFFRNGYAVHGTFAKNLGRPASHGCVRLSLEHVAILWDWVKQEGGQVSVQGQTPTPPAVARRHAAPSSRDYAARDARERDWRDRDRDVYYARSDSAARQTDPFPGRYATPRGPEDGYYRTRSTRTYTYRTDEDAMVLER